MNQPNRETYSGPGLYISMVPTRDNLEEVRAFLEVRERAWKRAEDRRALSAPWDDLITEACGFQEADHA